VIAKPLITVPSASADTENTLPDAAFTTAHPASDPQEVALSEVAGDVAALGPRMVRGLVMLTFSVYVPALTVMVSPATAASTAAWILVKSQPLAQTVRFVAAAEADGITATLPMVKVVATSETVSKLRSARMAILQKIKS